MDLHYLNDDRPPKRTRQACEQCRRKKAKRTGERPACSTCVRLRHKCYYAAEPHAKLSEESHEAFVHPRSSDSQDSRTEHELHNRIESLESSLAEVLQNIRSGGQSQASVSSPDTERPLYEDRNIPASVSSQLITVALPPWPTILALVDSYRVHCDGQPLPLFHCDTLRSSFPDRHPEIIFSFLALMIRYSDDTWMRRNAARESARYSQAAHQMVMNRINEGRVELSTIQALCLLSLAEFYSADQVRSRIHSSPAITLASCANLHNSFDNLMDSISAEERRRCYWSIILLRRLLGESTTPLDSHYRRLPSYPESPCTPPMAAVSPEGQRIASRSGLKSDGIVATVMQLSEVWSATQDYVRARGSSEPAVMPWSPDSKYSLTLRKLMDLGQKLPPLHMYRYIKPSSLTANDLEEARGYWAPWYLSRFLYHTIICILNHPLLITIQMQGIEGVSEVFLQQTTFSITHHTSWILHFIEFLEARRFRITDPIFGYCASQFQMINTDWLGDTFGDLGDTLRPNGTIA